MVSGAETHTFDPDIQLRLANLAASIVQDDQVDFYAKCFVRQKNKYHNGQRGLTFNE